MERVRLMDRRWAIILKLAVLLAADCVFLALNQEEGYAEGMLRGVLSCPSKLAIISMADWLGLDKEGRINTPSTLGDNWTWRAQPGVFTAALAKSIRTKCALYGRV